MWHLGVSCPESIITTNQCRCYRACLEHFWLDSEQVAEQDAACWCGHRQEASDGAHVAEDRYDERWSGKREADLLQHTDEDLTWEQLTSLDED
jgi:hypothetical protein